ncbi:hypothetical protein JXO52_07755 [bacterium]|nr:hypothetical protein [bacterium]
MKRVSHRMPAGALIALLVPAVLAASAGPAGKATLVSNKPLWFRVAFAAEPGRTILGVLDEGGGTGSGYSLVYLDLDRDGDPLNDPIQTFEETPGRNREIMGPFMIKFDLRGPVRKDLVGEYSIDLSLMHFYRQRGGAGSGDYLTWRLTAAGWRYLWVSGTIGLYDSAAEANRHDPVLLGSDSAWKITADRVRDGVKFSAGLYDANGCILRIVYSGDQLLDAGQVRKPEFRLMKGRETVLTQSMEFG